MIKEILNIFALLFAAILAFVFGVYLTKIYIQKQKKTLQNKMLKSSVGINSNEFISNYICEGFARKVIDNLIKVAYEISHISNRTWFFKLFIKSNNLNKKHKKLSQKAKMPEIFGNFALREVQIRYCLIGCLVGAFVGVLFSYYLMLILIICGLFSGLWIPIWALKEEEKLKTKNLEKCLPEMLEVLALGLRSGLTFDRSFKIYSSHFENEFSQACLNCQKKWEGSICSREDALRYLASSYDSALLSRVVENIIRSLRFGSALVESLEEAAVESRNIYKSKQEEIVSKAPVKMMIPTGTLILPAMLILVLGPILLELGSGF